MDNKTVQRIVVEALVQQRVTDADVLRAVEVWDVGMTEKNEVGLLAYNRAKDDGTTTRYKARVGKLLRKIVDGAMSDMELQEAGARVTARLWGGGDGDDGNGVRELEGEALRRFYLECVSGIHSCMAYESTQEYLDIYVDNPDRVKLATVIIGDHAARALVWTWPDGTRYMDRVYHTSQACREAIERYAKTQGISRDIYSLRRDELKMRIRDGYGSWWPYMDTMKHVTINSKRECSLSPYCGDYVLEDTNGGLGDPLVTCNHCDDAVGEDEAHYSENGDIYCESCYNELYTICRHCSTEIRNEDVENDEGLCPKCFDLLFTTCDDCGESIARSDAYEGPDGQLVCEDCSVGYLKCRGCHEIHQADSLVYGMCSDCAMTAMEQATRGGCGDDQ